MLKKIGAFLHSVPTPIGGLALGIASLGIGLENALPLHSLGQMLGALVSLLLVGLVLAKFLFYPGLFREDLRHPVAGSILPTLAMAMMLQSKSLSLISPSAAEALWLCAVGLHLVLLLAFTFFRAREFRLHHMVPSWFVPFVGISLAALTVPGPHYHAAAYSLMFFGLASYALMLPVMSYRLIFSREIADPFKPTIAIMAAPASLSLVSYLTLEPNPSLLLCSLLLGIAVLMTSIVYMAFFKLLRLPFSPAFAAYTFPMAVGAAALYKVAERLNDYPAVAAYSAQIKALAVFELVVATLVVLYVCFRFLTYYVQAWVAVRRARIIAKMEPLEASPAREPDTVRDTPVLRTVSLGSLSQ